MAIPRVENRLQALVAYLSAISKTLDDQQHYTCYIHMSI